MSFDPTRIEIRSGGYDDPFVQRMTGVARHGMTPFDCPFISHIEGNLFVGGCRDGLVLPMYIQNVVSLYRWERYSTAHEVSSFLEIEMYDDESGPDLELVGATVEWAASRVHAGPTLIHCQAGLNRSNLISATLLKRHMGYSPDEAIALLREKRSPAVLCNPTFARWVQENA